MYIIDWNHESLFYINDTQCVLHTQLITNFKVKH